MPFQFDHRNLGNLRVWLEQCRFFCLVVGVALLSSHRQLQHPRALPLRQQRHQNRVSIRKRQRIVMLMLTVCFDSTETCDLEASALGRDPVAIVFDVLVEGEFGAWAQADGYNHVNHFADVHAVGNALTHAGLQEPVLDVDRIELGYPDALTLMRDLKAIGAHNVTAGRPRALVGRARLARMQQAYEGFRRGQQLPATYEVIYGASWGAAGRPAGSRPTTWRRRSPSSVPCCSASPIFPCNIRTVERLIRDPR